MEKEKTRKIGIYSYVHDDLQIRTKRRTDIQKERHTDEQTDRYADKLS